MNSGFCSKCKSLVPAEAVERNGKVFLVRSCPKCGPTETLISGDATRYRAKRDLDAGFKYGSCHLNCLTCKHGKDPNVIFIDVTNRCNMNCPICINNTPSMGFTFEPPLDYFRKIFERVSQYNPKPSLQLFGGEPTMRQDLLEIIKMARSYGLTPRVVTNGIRLADEDYCRKLVDSRATILIAYDGADPQVYERLRSDKKYLELKQKAIDNIGKMDRAKVALMSLVGKGFNDQALGELFQYVHARRSFIRGVYFMPLAHTWNDTDFDLKPERITSEDIEASVAAAFPGNQVNFVPAAYLGQLPTLGRHLNIKPLPFIGAHPNCESVYLLFADSEKFRPVEYYLKEGLHALCRTLQLTEEKAAAREKALDAGLFGKALGAIRLKRGYARSRTVLTAGWNILSHARVSRVFKGRGMAKLYHAVAFVPSLIFAEDVKTALGRHTTIQGILQIIILPFEDSGTLETDRMERCPSAFAIYDPNSQEVKTVPVCAWGLHKTKAMREISDYYAAEKKQANIQPQPAGAPQGAA